MYSSTTIKYFEKHFSESKWLFRQKSCFVNAINISLGDFWHRIRIVGKKLFVECNSMELYWMQFLHPDCTEGGLYVKKFPTRFPKLFLLITTNVSSLFKFRLCAKIFRCNFWMFWYCYLNDFAVFINKKLPDSPQIFNRSTKHFFVC